MAFYFGQQVAGRRRPDRPTAREAFVFAAPPPPALSTSTAFTPSYLSTVGSGSSLPSRVLVAATSRDENGVSPEAYTIALEAENYTRKLLGTFNPLASEAGRRRWMQFYNEDVLAIIRSRTGVRISNRGYNGTPYEELTPDEIQRLLDFIRDFPQLANIYRR